MYFEFSKLDVFWVQRIRCLLSSMNQMYGGPWVPVLKFIFISFYLIKKVF